MMSVILDPPLRVLRRQSTPDRLSRRVAFPRASAGPADELTDNDRRIRIGTASGHPEASDL
jgi:hypothetical protein